MTRMIMTRITMSRRMIRRIMRTRILTRNIISGLIMTRMNMTKMIMTKKHEDLCINVSPPIVNARAHVLSRVRVFTTGARAFVHGSSYNLKVKLTIDHHIKFQKDPSFRWWDICKTILTFVWSIGVVNAHTRDKTCARAFTTGVRTFMHGSSWNFKLKLTR